MEQSRWCDLERPPLDVRALNRALATGTLWRDIRVVAETGSTNADVAELAKSGAAEGLVLVAEYQRTGRGRRGRSWSAPARSGLSVSILLRPDGVAPGRWSLLPLLVGVGVATGVSDVAGVPVSLKWPNDLLIGDRKLGGILAERVDTPIGPAAVVGCGLNVSVHESELPVSTATSLALAGAGCTDRDTVLRAALRGVAAHYTAWVAAGGDPGSVLSAYRPLCATLGRRVRVQLPGDRVVEGPAVGVSDDGSLLVESATGRVTLSAGDVVHLRS